MLPNQHCKVLKSLSRLISNMSDYLLPVENLYKDNLARFGNTSESVGWKSEESQFLRFEKLNQVIYRTSESISVNDYGCGYGAHLTSLINGGWNVSRYNAYDISGDMLQELKKTHADVDPKVLNCVQSPVISTQADYSMVSGTFNVMPDNDRSLWENHIMRTLKDLKKYSNYGFAFNLLTSYVDWKADRLYYADPSFWFNFCKLEITPTVTLIHDYELFEWTIICKLK
jgi:hypothetical protein